MSDRDRLIANPGRTQIGRVHAERVEVKDVGITVEVRDEIHAHTNHYIKQSKRYFPNEKLRVYIYCPHFLKITPIPGGFSVFGGIVVYGAPKAIPLFFFVVCLLLFLIFCQHEWVNQKTLPIVHKQPFFYDQRGLNCFYEVTITELDGIALQNYQAGIGFVEVTRGKIEFQAFNKKAKKHMSDAKCQSRVLLLAYLVASIYNCYFAAVFSFEPDATRWW